MRKSLSFQISSLMIGYMKITRIKAKVNKKFMLGQFVMLFVKHLVLNQMISLLEKSLHT